jgi:hypothetical protein
MSHARRGGLDDRSVWAIASRAPLAAQAFEFSWAAPRCSAPPVGCWKCTGPTIPDRSESVFRALVGLCASGCSSGTLPRFHLAPGDQSIRLVIPTDQFNRSYYFLGRGVGALRMTSRSGCSSTAGHPPALLSLFQAAAARRR